jgi:hypothetical protein
VCPSCNLRIRVGMIQYAGSLRLPWHLVGNMWRMAGAIHCVVDRQVPSTVGNQKAPHKGALNWRLGIPIAASHQLANHRCRQCYEMNFLQK